MSQGGRGEDGGRCAGRSLGGLRADEKVEGSGIEVGGGDGEASGSAAGATCAMASVRSQADADMMGTDDRLGEDDAKRAATVQTALQQHESSAPSSGSFFAAAVST